MLVEKYDSNLELLLRSEFHNLAPGLVGSALHGLIHTGYGFAARSSRLVCEGLAYLHHSYIPITLSPSAPPLELLGQGNMDVVDVLKMFRQDAELYTAMASEAVREDAAVRSHGYFQPRVAALLLHHGDTLAEYVQQVQFPAFFDPQSKSQDQLEKLLKWLVDCAIIVYIVAENPNDFFLVHGVTGAWSLRNILLTYTDYDKGCEVIRTYLCVLLAVYAAIDNPKICLQNLSADKGSTEVPWTELAEKAMAREYDEHIYKLVQVCWDMDRENPDVDMTKLYKLAASSAINNDLDLLPGVPRL